MTTMYRMLRKLNTTTGIRDMWPACLATLLLLTMGCLPSTSRAYTSPRCTSQPRATGYVVLCTACGNYLVFFAYTNVYGFMQDKMFVSNTFYGGHMGVNSYTHCKPGEMCFMT